MGIKGLMRIIADHAPAAIREQSIKSLFGRKVAVDASMSLYQFLIAVRTGADDSMLTNEAGEVTSHLQGIFYRTIRMYENGIKPVYVFDGKPPNLKGSELEKRRIRHEEAEKAFAEAKEKGDTEGVRKYGRRGVHVTREQNEDVITLLGLLGVPVVRAPCEAEAQCAEMCRAGLVYATATEDMDALTFGTPKMVRHLTFGAARKAPILEIDLKIVLEDLKMTQEQFVDFCILSGCDYTNTVAGVGPVTALKLIRKHKTMEKVLKSFEGTKKKVPEEFLYKEAALMFSSPEVIPAKDIHLKWGPPKEDAIIEFMCAKKGFAEDRIRNGIVKLKKARKKGSQMRLENFFGPVTLKRKKTPGGKVPAAKKRKLSKGTAKKKTTVKKSTTKKKK